MDAQEERGTRAIGDPGASDVAHARAGRLRPRHDDANAGALEKRPQPERDSHVQLGLTQAGDDTARSAAVLDLLRRGAGADRLRVGVPAQVVTRVDHHDRGGSRPCRPGQRRNDGRDDDSRCKKPLHEPVPLLTAIGREAPRDLDRRLDTDLRAATDDRGRVVELGVQRLGDLGHSRRLARLRARAELLEQLLGGAQKQRPVLERPRCDRDCCRDAERVRGHLRVPHLLGDLEALHDPALSLAEVLGR